MEPFPPAPELVEDPRPLAWREPEASPLEIDVGCHRGLFLVEMAQLYPAHNFLGIERQSERVERTQKKITRLSLTNAAIVRGEGFATLSALPPACADHIHVLFPDPWPKHRHQNRRMVQAGFIQLCGRLLKIGGVLRLVTDDPPYGAAMKMLTQNAEGFEFSETDDREYPLTEFQKKFLTDGRPVFRRLLRKI